MRREIALWVEQSRAHKVPFGPPTVDGRPRFDMGAEHSPERPALRHKHLGIWQEITWADYYSNVAATARKFWELGVRPGMHVAILCDNRPEWLYADLAAQALGARSVGVYQTSPAPDVEYIVNHSESCLLLCEDQEQVDKLMAIQQKTPTIKHVLVIEPRGTRSYDEPRLMDWEVFLASGHELLKENPH